MRRRLILVALLVGWPLAEIFALIGVAQLIGVVPTILLILATSVVGGWLLRREGVRAWRAFRDALAANRPPGNEATDGLLVLIGGILMVLPGFIGDLIGLLLVLPPTRPLGRAVVLRFVDRRLSSRARANLFGPRKVRVRQGPVRRNDPPPPPPPTTPPQAIEGEILPPKDNQG